MLRLTRDEQKPVRVHIGVEELATPNARDGEVVAFMRVFRENAVAFECYFSAGQSLELAQNLIDAAAIIRVRSEPVQLLDDFDRELFRPPSDT